MTAFDGIGDRGAALGWMGATITYPRSSTKRALLAALLAFGAATSASGPARADLRWSAPTTCPSEEEVRARTRALLAKDAKEPSAEVVVHADGARMVADIRVVSNAGDVGIRHLDGDTCAEVAKAVALVVAMSAREEPTTEPKVRQPEAPGELPPSRKVQPHFALGGEMSFGAMPNASPGARMVLGATRRALRAELDGRWSASQTSLVSSTVGGDFSRWAAGARACFVPSFGRFAAGGCAGIGLDVLSARGIGVPSVQDRTIAYLGPLVSGIFRWTIVGPLGIRAEAALEAPITRQKFVIQGVGTVFQVSPVTLGIFLGPELSL